MSIQHSRTRVRLFWCVLAVAIFAANFARVWAKKSAASPLKNPASFRAALPGYKFSFPRDHASHPEYATEWWYYTGHLQNAEAGSTPKQTFGYQLTFFRTALTPQTQKRQSKWATRNVIFAHLALTDETGKQFYFTDKISRDALGLSHAQTFSESQTPRIWIDDWQTQFKSNKGNQQTLHAFGTAQDGCTPFGISLSQRAAKPLVIHGENGVSQKSAGRGRASHYYSFPRLQTTGTVRVAGREYSVTGESWFDHEFGSNVLSANQTGWDWFSIQLDDGRELMIFQLRLKGGGVDPYSSGTLVEKSGSARHLKRGDFQIEVTKYWKSPHSKANYPAQWKVTVPSANIALEITPIISDQELSPQRGANVTYWEGSVRVGGRQSGRGYVEMTGYDKAFSGTF